MKLKIPLLALFILTFSVSYFAQSNPQQEDWEQFTSCGAKFLAPKIIKKSERVAADVCVAYFGDENLIFIISYNLSPKKIRKERIMVNFKDELMQIDGRKAHLFTYFVNDNVNGNPIKRYIAAVHIELNAAQTISSMKNSFNMLIFTENEKNSGIAAQIFKTIKFQN